MARNSSQFPALPTGTEVASFTTYEGAVEAIEKLAENDFPITSVAIVGSDMHVVERVMGRLTPARVALAGATQGLTWGLLFGLMTFFIMGDAAGLFPLLGIFFGVLMGIIFGMVSWSAGRKKKSFAAQTQLVASRYAVLVSEQTDRAFQLLQGMGSAPVRPRPTRTRPPVDPNKRPEFGVRLSPEERRKRDRENPKPDSEEE
ncbi:hypothetical protein FYJ24_05550 [Actinomycetaceae bacterium WB03_NA08]|uniref:General stress protein 17M-like domain-containing protein n=1 Tax=Scrofimicrobium canadense TaxID=2652290 RepID=A0A6N7VR65_9ACTO|nr:general stress protein [Scrofimicrobium canadense]MSS84239.1 hypothetical protein [Scrofimicrobium canadense]